MGVYIKGMEIPTSCWDCYFQNCGICRLFAYKVVDECIVEDRRDEDCPLVEVQPHGRLVDADDIEKRIKMWLDHPDEYIRKRNQDMLYYIQQEDTVIDAVYN